MKVKEIERTANVAWSPATQYPVYLVAGTAAQQLDATFSTSAALEVYSLNLADEGLSLPLVGSLPSAHRFYKVLWGCHGISTGDSPSGMIVAGSENGSVLGYNAAALIGGNEEAPTFKQDKHSGAVKALDFNPFQANLLASGACDSEIYIWDLNKPETPMSPGSKSMPPEEVTCISWNCQVQHILASTFSARCVVWDLRKNEPIIKVSDSMSGIKSHLISWNPEIATQLCLSSEDDHSPVIQLWDLRYATSPLRVFEKHQRGILSLAWCPQDPDLLLSCGKDNKILCWNPNTTIQGGEVVCEIETSNQWSFDVQWSPRNPGIISSASFDGHVTIHSLMSGESPSPATDKIADSFNADPFGVSQPSSRTASTIIPLLKPPKWLRKPVGANFAFGGKLVSFDYTAPSNPPNQNPAAGTPAQLRQVYISQVTTETEIMSRSTQLEEALKTNQLFEFCNMKAENSSNVMEQNIWNFLRTNFENEPRPKFLQLLGYDKSELSQKVVNHVNSKTAASGDIAKPDQSVQPKFDGVTESYEFVSGDKAFLTDEPRIINDDFGFDSGPIGGNEGIIAKEAIAEDHGINAAELAEKMSQLNATTPNSIGEPSEASSMFEDIALQQRNLSGSVSPLVIPTNSGQSGTSGTQSPLLIPAQTARSGTRSPLASTQPEGSAASLAIPTQTGAEGLLGQALLTGNFEAAVEMCLHENKMAEAILLAVAGGPELLSRTQEKYFTSNKSCLSRLISSIVTRDWNHIIRTCDLQNWKEALAVIITYASPEEFAMLCDSLGHRLEVDNGGEYSLYASLCYICSGNVQKLVENWQNNSQSTESPMALQDLVEKVMMLRKAVELSQGSDSSITQGLVAGKLTTYASILAAQGCLETAMNYLGKSTEKSLDILRDRLYQALGGNFANPPVFPFDKVDILPEGVRPVQQPSQQPARQSAQPLQSYTTQQQQMPTSQSMYAQQQQYPSKQRYQPNSQQRQGLQNQQQEEQNAHQTQAISQFCTNTTPSSYFGVNQYPNTNGPTNAAPTPANIPQVPSYPTHMSSMMTPASGAPMSKGPLAHKYPQAPTDPSITGYGMDAYKQPNVMMPDYSTPYQQPQQQPQPYYGNTYPSQGIYQPQPTPTPVPSQQTNVYNSMSTPGAPQPSPLMADSPLAPSFQEMKPNTPWNDPPLLKDKIASQQQTGWNDPPLVDSKLNQPFEVPGPITTPIYGVATNNEQPPPGAPVNNYPNIYNPQEHQAPVQPPAPVPAAEPVPEVVKGPIPNEHQVLQDIFDALVGKCLKAANNAQTKKKLEDVARKLEVLYDKLRDNSLSQHILLGLHQIIQALQQCDYDGGLQIYTYIISQGNFSEIGSFMPGLKMLMQTANNLKVYVQ